MNIPNGITLWELIYSIPYNEQDWVVIEELQLTEAFNLNQKQYQELTELISDLRELIDGLNKRDDIFSQTDNGSEDADIICEKLGLDGNKPIITYDPITRDSKLDLYLYQTI